MKDDWTFAIGLRRVLVHEALWGVVCAALLAGVFWIASPALNWLAGMLRARCLIPATAAAASAPAIWLLWHQAKEKAGFTGWFMGVIALSAISCVGVTAALVPRLYGPLSDVAAYGVIAGIILAGLFTIIYDRLTD